MLENTSIKKGQQSRYLNRFFTELVWHITPPLIFFLGMSWFFPYWNSIWIVNDEGYNLMKAMLVERGYHLYSQIWSDQAPLLTYLLAAIFRVNGYGFITSRYLILIFSCVLIWAVAQYVRLTWGTPHALVGVVILVLLPSFLVISGTVLVGQPSLTFATLSMLALAVWHIKRKSIFCVLSAVALSLSLLTKLFTGFLIPVFLLGLLVGEYLEAGKKKNWMKVIRPALIWGLILFGVTIGLGILMVNPAYAGQLILPHVGAALAKEYPLNESIRPIGYYLQPAWPVLVAAMVGIVVAWKQKRWLAVYPVAWMVIVYPLLLIDKPVWWHHQFLITVPATILAAGAIGEGLLVLIQVAKNPSTFRKGWFLLSAGLVSLVLICAVRIPDVIQFLRMEPVRGEESNSAEAKLLRKIRQYAPETKWMITDMPMLPFLAGLPVPPELTVMSWKRLAAGDLNEADIVKSLREYHPEQVLLGRFSLPTVTQYLSENYKVIHQRGTTILYLRKDLQK